MEVVGTVASAVTLLGVAVKGTEALYQIISGFRDASLHTGSIDSAIRSLEIILTQLKTNNALAKDDTDLSDFKELIKEYCVNVERYQKDLQKIQITPKDSRTKIISKKLKGVILGDKHISRVLGEITQRCTTLGFQTNLLQYNATVTVKEKVLELNTASLARANHDINQSNLLRQQTANLSAINGRVKNVQISTDNVHEAVMIMTEKMEQIPQVSRAQSEDIRTLLVALQSQISGLSNPAVNPQCTFQSQSIRIQENCDTAEKDSELVESIERLKSVASQKEGDVGDEEAESLIDDLGCVLHAVLESPDNRHTTSSKRKLDALSETEDISVREIKRLCSMVASSHGISLNSRPPRSGLGMNQKILQKHKIKKVTTRRYDITVTLNERNFLIIDDGQSPHIPQSSSIETITRVKILEKSKIPTILMAYLRRVQRNRGFFFLNPVISIGKTLPDDSLVFTVVECGNVDQLKSLLTRHHCTLRDRDSYGTPLLHYAMSQPAMCKFLVDYGADVDEIASDVHNRKYHRHPMSYHSLDGEVNDKESLQDIIECRRLLLDAGADPTLSSSAGDSPLEFCLESGTLNSLKVILDLGEPFIDIEKSDDYAHTPLLLLAQNCSNGYDAGRFKLLLDRGANIHARDHTGRTCLHTAVERANLLTPCGKEMEAVVLLIQRGANVFTTDNGGRSIFDDAYDFDYEERINVGGYRGDLWDAALVQCGHQKSIRKPEERICHYTQRYTQEDFERLWRGREHLCPYFTHPPVLCPYIEELSESETEEELSGSGLEEELSGSEVEEELFSECRSHLD